MAFLGYCQIGSAITVPVQTTSSSVPTAADAAPRRQVYAAADGTRLDAVAGQASNMHTGSITGATNATPIVITSTAHGLQTGARVTVSGVGGNTAANTTATITRVSADTFSLDGVAGNGAYTSGGTWTVTGLYSHSITASAGNGFSAGQTYFVVSTWAISTSARSQIDSFVVV